MRLVGLGLAPLLLLSCEGHQVRRTVTGPAGITAEIVERSGGHSDTLDVSLYSPRARQRVPIFEGRDGSSAKVVFDGNLVIVQYCYPASYRVRSYIYSIGEDYDYTDIRIAAATVESQIGTARFCAGGINGAVG
jgi:hypothetical protein